MMSGWRAASRKSIERRCASRSGTCVSMLLASMATSTDDAPGTASANRKLPDQRVKWPRTVEMTMWRTEKPMLECALSTFHCLRIIVVS